MNVAEALELVWLVCLRTLEQQERTKDLGGTARPPFRLFSRKKEGEDESESLRLKSLHWANVYAQEALLLGRSKGFYVGESTVPSEPVRQLVEKVFRDLPARRDWRWDSFGVPQERLRAARTTLQRFAFKSGRQLATFAAEQARFDLAPVPVPVSELAPALNPKPLDEATS